MKMTLNTARTLGAAIVLSASFAASAKAQPAPPEIAYQGRLALAGQPVTGVYDFRFALFASSVGDPGCLITSSPSSCGQWWGQRDDVQVHAGRFGVTLGPIDNATLAQNELWLAIAVKADGASSYTLLQGKQRLTDVPRAAAAHDFSVSGSIDVDGDIDVAGQVRFGQSMGDQVDAGKMAYRNSWDPASFNIVGAGTTGADRKVHVWDYLIVGNTTGGAVHLPAGRTLNGTQLSSTTIKGIEVWTSPAVSLSITNYSASGSQTSPAGWNEATSVCMLAEYVFDHDHGNGAGSESRGECRVRPDGAADGNGRPRWRLYGLVDQTTNGDGVLYCTMRCIRWDW